MVDAETGSLGHVGVALSFGLVIMAMVYAVGPVSGELAGLCTYLIAPALGAVAGVVASQVIRDGHEVGERR